MKTPKWNGALKYDSCRMVDDQKLKKVGHIVYNNEYEIIPKLSVWLDIYICYLKMFTD